MVWRTLISLSFVSFVAVSVHGERPIDFDTEVMPVLTRQGCNAGSCHGAAIGRGGFKLSLLGSNAKADHDAIVRHLEGRRINLAHPQRSLVLLKPSEQVGHEGGSVMEEGSEAFDLVHRWITEGATRPGVRILRDLKITPQKATLEQPGNSASVQVRASFNDESTEDVTKWTVFQSADPDSISIEPGTGTITVHRRGVHVVMARFLDRVMAIRFTVPMQDEYPTNGTPLVANNRVDEFIDTQLQQLRLPASPPSDDWTFLRRVTLDLAGRLPTSTEAKRFAADKSDDKRQTIVRQLLQSDAFADYWALKWANYLGIDSKQLQPEGARAYHRWLRDQFAAGTPWNQTATEMLTLSGDSFEIGSLNFLRSAGSPGELAERTSRSLMGVRLQCANCHDHPLDHWKQDDYHGLAAVFAKLSRQREVAESERGEVTHPVTGQAAIARIPGERYLDPSEDGRGELANWLTSAENPYFSKAIVNRIWQHLMGRGLVDPVDDLRATNPATHPDLLNWLADDFARNGFRIRHTIETICQSAAYARDSATLPGNEADSEFYSHALIKPLEAEVIADAIADASGVPIRVDQEELPRTVTLTDNQMAIPALDVLGRCDRETSCSETESSASLARSLHLINGELINKRVIADEGRISKLLRKTSDNAEVLDEIFLWALTRPNASSDPFWKMELAKLEGSSPQSRRTFFEDVMWGLLTSQAFMTNR